MRSLDTGEGNSGADEECRSQQRMPIQVLEEAKDSVTSLVVQGHLVITGSVDGFVRTYDIRQGELRTDFFDRSSFSLLLPTCDS
mgnify:FL=1